MSEKVNIVATPNSTGTAIVVANDFYTNTSGLSATQNTLGGYDALIENYRKVVDVKGFEEGSTSGVNTLFTIEQTLAQQTYFSYLMATILGLIVPTAGRKSCVFYMMETIRNRSEHTTSFQTDETVVVLS